MILRNLCTALVACSLLTVVGCAVKGEAKVGRSESSARSDDTPSGFESSGTPPPSADAPSSAPTTESGADGGASTAEPVQPRPGCSLVCNVAHRGKVPAAEEARLTQALAGITNDLRQCMSGRLPSMTLRFDSKGAITHFGVDEERGESVCVDAANRRLPAVAYPGPATLRCVERCKR